MNTFELLRIALRYTFAQGRGYLSTFLSTLAMLGLVLAIALLITVLSVMNGFDKEMRERILGLVPHVTVFSHLPVDDWQEISAKIETHPQVVKVAPFAQFDALFMRGAQIETGRGIGLDAAVEGRHGELFGGFVTGQIQRFNQTPDGLILGSGIAQRLAVKLGDQLSLVVPGKGRRDSLTASRFQTVTVSGILESGTELDQSVAVLHLALASELAGLNGAVSGLRITTSDIFSASSIGWELMNTLPSGYYTTNWMMTHGNLYSAIQLSRNLITILLLSIIAVAAFNVVSSLVLVVFDKRGDVAILRTLGASPMNIAWIFVLQGALIGLVGVSLGAGVGTVISLLVPDFVALLEALLDIRFLNTDVYPVSFLPVDILMSDILVVSGVAFTMCVLAAIYPALRAARLAPATILHQER